METQTFKIDNEELTEEIALALKDYFKAEIEYKSNNINVVFDGGEKFIVSVTKVS